MTEPKKKLPKKPETVPPETQRRGVKIPQSKPQLKRWRNVGGWRERGKGHS